jgi:hypothetical protein
MGEDKDDFVRPLAEALQAQVKLAHCLAPGCLPQSITSL